MSARMTNPVFVLEGLLPALQRASKAAARSGALPETTKLLVHTRVSQINGCAVCVDMHAEELRNLGEADQRLFTLATWRDAPYFTDAERAALDLAEYATRIADAAGDPVPDAVWDAAAAHLDDQALAALVAEIALINAWNRINVVTKQVAGFHRQWGAQPAEAAAPADAAAAPAAR